MTSAQMNPFVLLNAVKELRKEFYKVILVNTEFQFLRVAQKDKLL